MFPPDDGSITPDLLDSETAPLLEEPEIAEEEEPSPGQVPDEHQKAFKIILDQIIASERDVRFQQVQSLKRNELFWLGQYNLYWNYAMGDWQSVENGVRAYGKDDLNVDASLYEKARVGIYRAYGESVIGAVSSGVPHVRYFPLNPNDAGDINTAEAYSLLGEKIEDENDGELLVRRGMTLLWNQGFIAAYNYSHFDKKYGSLKQKVFGAKSYIDETKTCPICNAEVSNSYYPTPSDDTLESDAEILSKGFDESGKLSLPDMPGLEMCPECQEMVLPESNKMLFDAPYVKKEIDQPKCRQIIEFYGPLNVQIPYYAKLPKDIGYVILSTENHYAQMRSLYEGVIQNDGATLASKINAGPINDDTYERFARSTTTDYFSTDNQLVTTRRIWYEPWMFDSLKDPELIAELKEAYPDGVYVVFINEIFAEAYPESLQDHWTFTINPLEERINASPFGKFLIPVQEMINELIFLILQTIQFGVPLTFVDEKKIALDKIDQATLTPGGMVPVSNRGAGEGIGDYFASIPLAHLPNEVFDFLKSLEFYSQLVSGAFPQIYGGATNNRTLGQDENARNQALQRLATAWKMINEFWATFMSKAVKSHIKDMMEDETYVKEVGQSRIAVEVRLEDITGEIGEVRPETNDQFPISWSQQRDEVMKLIELNNPQFLQILMHPENIGLMKKILGIEQLYVPGDDDRNKQLSEIEGLIQGAPMMGLDGMPISSIPIEPIDNDQIHSEVVRCFLSSPVGQMLKKQNPMAYENVMIHGQEHDMRMQMQMMQQQEAAMQQEEAGKKEEPKQ